LIVLSVLLSAFIDNVPFIAVMLPVVAGMAQAMGVSPYPLYFALVIAVSVGGNISPVGASANVVAVDILKNEKRCVSFWDFARIGIPFTVVGVTAASAFIWLVFH